MATRWSSGVVGALVLLAVLGCERKEIPPRHVPAPADPSVWLEGGELVFEDDFEREQLGDDWTTEHPGWEIRAGEVRDHSAKNKGLWLKKLLPPKTRVEFDLRSDPRTDGKPFAGDVKVEIFATEPLHQAGYVLINGGWSNQLDVVARLDEHGEDRKEQPATKVVSGQAGRWSVVRTDGTLHWFRDGQLHMSYPDGQPVQGGYLGFNNWLSNVAYDNLKVYDLSSVAGGS